MAGASATTLGLSTHSPFVESNGAIVDYFEFSGDGDLSTFGAPVSSFGGIPPTGVADISFGVGFSLGNPTSGASGGFDVFDDDGLFLGGDLFKVGYTSNVIELQFNNLIGSSAGDFGSSVLALIIFDENLGPNPFAGLVDGNSYNASVKVSSVSEVPLPSTLPLFLMGLGLLGFVGYRRRCRHNYSARL